ncbi:MAG TPA: S-methyl-5-thioribose-1-phosphate isomerase [Gemmatimonadaceae bacterium]|nr:S-methyl-5-thioribose-1-phosphate isomerase [Gemmatimonadaceae bacterium]
MNPASQPSTEPPLQAVGWSPAQDAVRIIDQTELPEREIVRDLRSLDDVARAIARLEVRGAPAIGIAAAMGLVVSLDPHAGESRAAFLELARAHAARLRETRPTAVNLAWALERVLQAAERGEGSPRELLQRMRDEATAILEEDRAMCRRIGELGAPLVPDDACVLTHCNAGALATGGTGTALAPVYRAVELGRRVRVVVGETRPLLQGSRLTAWELTRAGIPVTVIPDSAAAALMRRGDVSFCLVGGDRVAANGDVANKIGTYALALAARHHAIPFYVAVPSSTLDPATPLGASIAIEERPREEIARLQGMSAPLLPDGAAVWNPAFDVTPAELVTAIITDRAVYRPPYRFESRASRSTRDVATSANGGAASPGARSATSTTLSAEPR